MAIATLTINLAALKRNWKSLAAYSAGGTATAAVVKADGYGLGVEKVSQALHAAGATEFFVAAAEEGGQVRRAVPAAKIYVFSGYMQNDAKLYADHNLIPLINSPVQLANWRAEMQARDFGLQLDTGMNRLGIEPDEFSSMFDAASESCLLISHLACADEPEHPMNRQQLDVFRAMTDSLVSTSGISRSLAATGGTLLGKDFHFDLVRPGIGLYGGLPYADAEPVVSLSLPVIQSRIVEPGETVGYGAAWRASKQTHVATLAAGYADGILRELGRGSPGDTTSSSKSVKLYSSGVACSMIGRVSMDMITVDISNIGDTLESVPETMELLCAEQGIDTLASSANTIGYEILTACGNRYQRNFVDA